MKSRKIFAICLFLLGLAFISYPFISRTYYDYNTKREVALISKDLMNDSSAELIYEEQMNYNQSKVSNINEIEVAKVGFVEETDIEAASGTKNKDTISDEQVIAILRIPSINLEYPIYDGATEANLLKGLARIEGTSYPVGGINTNSVIAGHSGMVNRTYFSHIKNLKKGDIVEIQNKKETLRYEVYKTAVIEPDNTAALAVIPGQDTITLLTCTWPPPGTHRFLVYAKRI